MEKPTTIGMDANGAAVLKRKLRRSQVPAFFEGVEPCLVGLEARAFGGRSIPRTAHRSASPHYWARELAAPGHEVRIMPPSYVKPNVKRGKTDGEARPWPFCRRRTVGSTGPRKRATGAFPFSAAPVS